jgi:hypothetical protein
MMPSGVASSRHRGPRRQPRGPRPSRCDQGETVLLEFGVFDATGGNANVSLEFGLAEANEIPCAKTANKMTAIPADMVAKVKAAIKDKK